MNILTEENILGKIKKYVESNESFPTYTELKKILKLRKDTELKKILRKLEKLDLIRTNFITKAIEYTQSPKLKIDNFIHVPLLGKIAAGKPIEAIVDFDNILILPSSMGKNREVFALKVAGDSMIDSYLLPDDIVVCERTNVARNGDMIVALFPDNTATLKKIYKEKDQIRLQPMNEKYPPIYTKKITIQGKVISLVREY